MNRSELIFITLPLIVLLIGIIIYEIQTVLILNKVLIPAGIYFLIVSCIYGSKPWWHFPLGLVCMLLLFILGATIIEKAIGSIIIGGGAIKLLAVIGAALGIVLALKVGVVFVILASIAYIFSKYVFGIDILPSSPFILFSILSVYIWNYGFRFFIPK